MSERHAEPEQRVTPLELFFDLVFAFAFTQVTAVLADDPTWGGLGHGLLILAVLWWGWAAYAWLTNTVDPGDGAVWGAMLVAIAAMFVAALAVPKAFGRHGVVFGVAFLIVNVMHLILYALGARGDRDLLAAILGSLPRPSPARLCSPSQGSSTAHSGRCCGWPRSPSACSGRCLVG